MSWQNYIDMVLSPNDSGDSIVEQAAICGIAGGQESLWASTPGFTPSSEEIKRLLSKRSEFAQNGTHIAGIKCRLLRDNLEDEGIHTLNLKTAADSDGNSYNVSVCKSKTALIIAKGKKDVPGGQVAAKAFFVADYLRKANF